ncbi:MAG: chromosomal replication initiator protein DnaA [Firmicutes bacterium]|nr:chromosomal replication initiator protein DnaA [Bacillota bacterium]
MRDNRTSDDIAKWGLVLEKIKRTVNGAQFDNFVKQLNILSVDTDMGKILLATNSPTVRNVMNQRYLPVLRQAAAEVYEREIQIEIMIRQDSQDINPLKAMTQTTDPAGRGDTRQPYSEQSLNPSYTFASFVVGSNNELAYAACNAAARGPAAVNSNPLFIYGSSGLGKTHLINAIGNYILKNDPKRKFLYLSSERFTNEMVNALQNHEMDKFREKYRNTDILMIDDVQFIEKKESTQEELFHTFNELYESNRQIVFTSDRPPKDIATIDQRLKSRFEWGLSVDIQPPDFETRVAILKNKAAMDNITIDDSIFYVIAENITTNIRELEGALNRIGAYVTLMNRPITKEQAASILRQSFNIKERTVDIPLIKNTVCAKYNINVQDMDSSKRKKDIAHPRQIAMYLCRELTGISLPKIGKEFGNRDHTTVMHAVNKISEELEKDSGFKTEIEELKRSIMD